MSLQQFTEVLADIRRSGQNVYLKFEPEVLDFTDTDAAPILHIYGSGGFQHHIKLDTDFLTVISILQISVLAAGRKIICWNWKNFLSYVLARTGKPYQVEGDILDLKIMEAYLGERNKAPDSLAEALRRLRRLVQDGLWQSIQTAYKSVYLPVITSVVPHLETTGILDTKNGERLYAYYEINGQENGRFLCSRSYGKGYVPHTLGPDERERFKPRYLDELFMYFDFNNNEVSVLQWLTKDKALQAMLEKPGDFYSHLFKAIVGKDCTTTEQRKQAKKFFLPVIYGQQAPTLSQSIKVAEPTAEKIISRLNLLFPETFAWIDKQVHDAQEAGFACDCHGRRRYFDKSIKIRNFSVQSPASLACSEKLVELYRAVSEITDIAYHVHDGYVVYSRKDNWRKIFQKSHEALTSASVLFPGLELKVSCYAGRNLNELKPLVKPSKGGT